MKNRDQSSFSTIEIKIAPSPLKNFPKGSCQRIIGPKNLRRLIRSLPWMTVKRGWPGFKKKKKDIQIIVVVTNNLSVPQAARLLLPVMPYFHDILKLTAKTSQGKEGKKKKNNPK